MSDVPVPSADGTRRVPADRLTGEQRQRLSLWWNRAPRVLGGQDPHALEEFAGETMAGIELPTDPDVIELLGFLGELSIPDFYIDPESTT